ncbi:7438_t:CDS:2 [Diversispora eburnea]|uniref:7438_t:CDS:1 n=1 Tax=Diversispora eburnea TaxID=1213867 RepID=A0A9N9B769_9GLOM|nr:7438_t:CDS:2 [Diversispora eburnea]
MSKKHKEPLSLSTTTEKDSLFFSSYVAKSPDSQQIVTFSPEFKLYDINYLSSSKHISTPGYGSNDKHLCDLESGEKYLRPQMWVVYTNDDVNEIYTSSISGVIRFIDSDDTSRIFVSSQHPPILAISQNKNILVFCWGTTSITLFLMENGLEITTKQLEGQREIYKIVDINFIDNIIPRCAYGSLISPHVIGGREVLHKR